MGPDLPTKANPSHRLGSWLNRLRDYCQHIKPVATADIYPKFTAAGVGFFLNEKGKKTAGGDTFISATLGMNYRGEYSDRLDYSVQDTFVVITGVNAGFYLVLLPIAKGTVDPFATPAVQLIAKNAVATWT